MRLIEECRHWWRLWSMRVNALGLALLGWVAVDPVTVLSVWNLMPGNVSRQLPPGLVAGIGAVLFGLSMLSRLVRQPKLEKRP